MVRVTVTPRRLACRKADSTAIAANCPHSTARVRWAEAIRPTRVTLEPGLHTSPPTVGTRWTGAPLQSLANTDSMDATAAGWRSRTT